MMAHYKFFTVFLLTFACCSAALAVPECAPTARVEPKNYPGTAVIPTGNNLLRPAGKAMEAAGQKLILTGRVLDSNCAPVREAIVELWQVNPFGRWLLAEPRDLATPNAIFAGAGRTYTNGNGEFTFITAFPAALEKRAPFVNIKIYGGNIKGTATTLFFGDDARNATDIVYKKLPELSRDDVSISMQMDASGNLLGSVTVVLPGKAPFRVY